MKAQFKFLSGARTGQTETVRKSYIGIGRHPMSDVRFDTERDLDVSARHAAIVRRGDGFVIQDLGSKNGTFVNGERVAHERVLANGDVIGLGANGPSVEFHWVDDESGVTATAEAAAARASQPRAVIAAQPPRRSSTAVRVALEVAKQTKHLRWLIAGLVLVVLVFGGLQWKGVRDRQRDLAELRARADSLVAETQRTRSEVAELQHALEQAREETQRLQRELSAGGDATTLARLRDELAAAEQRQRGLVGAATVDYRAIARANQNAIALVLVEWAPGDGSSGTGFAVDSQGTIVTNKHVVVGEDGTKRPQRIGVMFAGSTQLFRAELVVTSPDFDIAVLRAPIRGGNPKVAGLSAERNVERGDPVAIMGFPLGLDLPMDRVGQQRVADPTLTVGTVSRVLTGLVQVDGYGAPGSSGSPVFDRQGKVVGLLFGGVRESAGRIVYAVPSQVVSEFLTAQGFRN